MDKIINSFLNILKFLLLIIATIAVSYILFFMYQRVDRGLIDIMISVLPYILLLMLFVFNSVLFKGNTVGYIFYNIVCCMGLITIIFCCYRAIFDDFLLIKGIYASGINYNYFSSLISVFNILIYGLVLSNILIIFNTRKELRGGTDVKE